MKVGGNGAASEFFASHGGSSLLAPGTEGKVKYTSQAAMLYKAELQKRELADAHGQSLSTPFTLPGMGDAGKAKAAQPADDDFFGEWDTPAAAPAAAAAPPAAESPAAAAASPPAAPAPAPAAPRPVTSAALRSSAPTASRPSALGAVRTGGAAAAGARPAKKGFGGVRKMGAPVDFDEAARRAREERARAAAEAAEAQRQAEAAEQQAQAHADAAAAAAVAAAQQQQQQKQQQAAAAAKASPNASKPKDASQQGIDRLGMGFTRLGLAQARSNAALQKNAAPAASASAGSDNDESNYARSKFASQKSISSDQYFQRGGYDPTLSSEAESRLSNFQGQTSISSNQYFGREEEDEEEPGFADSPGRDDMASDLEASAREFYRRLMANPDVQQGIDTFRAGAMKLSQYLEDLSRNGY